MYETLPFKDYTVLNNVLVQSLGCTDAYRAYVLALTTDKRMLDTDTTIEQLAFFVGESSDNYKSGSRNKSFNDKLKATNEVTLMPFRANGHDRNRYIFNQPTYGEYRRIGRVFYDKWNHHPQKELLGFILKLFSVAEPHSYLITKSVRQLEKLIHMGHNTITKYMGQLEELGLLQPIEDGWLLKVDGLILDQPGQKRIKELILSLDSTLASHSNSKDPLPRYLRAYQFYKDKNFEGVKNLENLLITLSYGMAKYPKRQKKDEQSYPDIIL